MKRPLLLLATLLALAACGGGEDAVPTPETPADTPVPDATTPSPETATPSPATPTPTPRAGPPAPCTGPEPPLADAPDWPHPNYDAGGSRATFTSAITSDNVKSLEVAWSYELPSGGAFGIIATTPIVSGGVVYVGDLQTNVHAIDFESGNRRWMVDVEQWTYGPSGVAVSGGCVFANLGGHSIVAYRAIDGERLWSTNILADGGAVNFQPLVAGGTVFAATSSLSQPAARGALYALDPSTGDIRWSFNTILSEDVWGNPEINSGGGAWYPPALDLEAGVSYWGTSNPYPYPGVEGYPLGASRPGDNRWTNSILAVDIATGELRWGVQHIPHDIFDRDAVLTGIATLDDGAEVIISTGKLGRVFGLDPDGTVLWETPVGIHKNDDVTEFEGEIEVMPGNAGGVVTPIAIAEGVVYLVVVNAPTKYRPDVPEGVGTSLNVHPSQMVAIDARDGEVIWKTDLPGDAFGGATVVNDLVFTSVITGVILALDRATGEIVWGHQAAGGINGWPAVAGDTLLVPVGFGDPGFLLALRLPR
ncbi:MAG: PQQ-binding-like beta-propeller repeat protein [Chloroflexi bacterium]|nr:PQQ-binding-like beta-propeller repeat protein [Chloroflexota bacterium]